MWATHKFLCGDTQSSLGMGMLSKFQTGSLKKKNHCRRLCAGNMSVMFLFTWKKWQACSSLGMSKYKQWETKGQKKLHVEIKKILPTSQKTHKQKNCIAHCSTPDYRLITLYYCINKTCFVVYLLKSSAIFAAIHQPSVLDVVQIRKVVFIKVSTFTTTDS